MLSFSVGKQYLKARASYAFESERAKPDQWGISTWSRKVARLQIMKCGNDSDKASLPVATRYNQPRQQRKTRNRPLADLRRTRQRVERAIDGEQEPRQTDEEPAAATNDGDGLLPDDGDTTTGTRTTSASTARRTTTTTTTTTGTTTAVEGRKRRREGDNFFGECCIAGCTWQQLELNHHCYRCRKEVHNMCAQANNLCGTDNELNMYCSLECKN
jgi:hypothetical protein